MRSGDLHKKQRLGNATLASDGKWKLVLDTATFAKGTYPVTAKAVDAAGNTTTSAPIQLTIAATATPTPTATPTATATPTPTATP